MDASLGSFPLLFTGTSCCYFPQFMLPNLGLNAFCLPQKAHIQGISSDTMGLATKFLFLSLLDYIAPDHLVEHVHSSSIAQQRCHPQFPSHTTTTYFENLIVELYVLCAFNTHVKA